MGTFRITVEIADPQGRRFEPVEMLADTGAAFTKAPRELLERLDVPVESTYSSELADGSRVQRTLGRTVIRLEGKEFPTPVTFGQDGEQSLLGAMDLEDARLAADPHLMRLIPVDDLEMTSRENANEESDRHRDGRCLSPFKSQEVRRPRYSLLNQCET